MSDFPIHVHVPNETAVLKTVIVGIPQDSGPQPTLEETYDARSYRSVEENNYPLEKDIISEMEGLAKCLNDMGVQVLRPRLLPSYNQLFARDVAFAIDNKLFVANMIEERQNEIKAYEDILSQVDSSSIFYMPKEVQAEGGDIMLYNDILFMGVTDDDRFDTYKMARTNMAAYRFLQEQFPNKKVYALSLKKHDSKPEEGILHLDCAFQPIGNGKAIYYPEAFSSEEDVLLIENIFGKENLFAITADEAFNLTTNIFSVAPNKVIIEQNFKRLAHHLENIWNIEVIPIPYHEISKQGGLLRCSTCPLVRN